MKFWIKARHNPQLGTYYVAVGKLSKKAAKAMEGTLYGSNEMLPFDTEESYRAKIAELKTQGDRVEVR